MSEAEKLSIEILKRFENKTLSPEQLPSKRELAREFGLSPATVSNAIKILKDSGKLRTVPGRGVYMADFKGSAASPSGMTIGLAGAYIPEPRDLDRDGIEIVSKAPILDGIWESAQEAGAVLVMLPGMSQSVDIAMFKKLRLDGLIIAGGLPHSELLALRNCGIPVILANYTAPAVPPLNFVDFDNIWMIREAVKIFKANGHQRIAFTGTMGTSVAGYSEWLKEQFFIALIKEGLHYRYEDYVSLEEQYTKDKLPAYDSTLKMLEMPEPPTAFFAWQQVFAKGMSAAFAEKKLKVPEDVSIIVSARDTYEKFSIFSLPMREVGHRLFSNLAAMTVNPTHFAAEFIRPTYIDNSSVGRKG